jgi:hypothetical protein
MLRPRVHAFGSKNEFVAVIVVEAEVGSTVTLFCQYGDGAPEPVRGAFNLLIKRPETLIVDYEVPQGYELRYWAVATKGTEKIESERSVCGPFNFGGDVIFDLADPKRAMVINVESFKTLNYAISRDVQRVWGRRDPVVISGVREFPSGQLNLITLNLEERKNFLSIVTDGSTIAFGPHSPKYGLEGVVYFAVGSIAEERTSRFAVEDSRRWILEVQQIAPPPAMYRFPDYGKTWRQLRDNEWSRYLDTQWWEEIA